jgi:multisubunit Na+/H+ antiporter MnhE subunit
MPMITIQGFILGFIVGAVVILGGMLIILNIIDND